MIAETSRVPGGLFIFGVKSSAKMSINTESSESEVNYTPFRKSLIAGRGALNRKMPEEQARSSTNTHSEETEQIMDRLEPTLSGKSYKILPFLALECNK